MNNAKNLSKVEDSASIFNMIINNSYLLWDRYTSKYFLSEFLTFIIDKKLSVYVSKSQ